jgi:transcriptional regulator with XRE-family HTH domain
MSTTPIPGPVANQLRQGLTLRIGTAAQALEETSLIDRRNRTYEKIAEHFQQIDALHALLDALGWQHQPDPMAIRVDLDAHRSAVDAGLDEAIGILRDFTDEGSPGAHRQAAAELHEVEVFKTSLPAMEAGAPRPTKESINRQMGLICLGETFQRVRKQQQISVADLAGRTGIDAVQISNLESGRLDPEYDLLIALADGLGVRPYAFDSRVLHEVVPSRPGSGGSLGSRRQTLRRRSSALGLVQGHDVPRHHHRVNGEELTDGGWLSGPHSTARRVVYQALNQTDHSDVVAGHRDRCSDLRTHGNR